MTMLDRFRVWLLRGETGNGYGERSLFVRVQLRLFRAITPSRWIHPSIRPSHAAWRED